MIPEKDTNMTFCHVVFCTDQCAYLIHFKLL